MSENKKIADIIWRLTDIREMLLTQKIIGDRGSLYGLDEWSTPITNLDLAICKLNDLGVALQIEKDLP